MCTARFVTLPQRLPAGGDAAPHKEGNSFGIIIGEKRKLDSETASNVDAESFLVLQTQEDELNDVVGATQDSLPPMSQDSLPPMSQDSFLPMSQDVRPSESQPSVLAASVANSEKEKRLKEEEEEAKSCSKSWVLQNCLPRQWDGNGNEKGERISRPSPVWEQVRCQANKGKVWSWGKNGFDMVEEKYRPAHRNSDCAWH